MWNTIRETKSGNQEYIKFYFELVESSSRMLVITTSVLGGGWLLLIGLLKSGQISLEIMPVAFGMVLAFLLCYALISRNLLASQYTWLISVGILINLAVITLHEREICFLFALIPLMAVSMIGWQSAIFAGILVLADLFGLRLWLGPTFIPLSTIGVIGFGEALAGFIGWSAVSPLTTMVAWTHYSYRMARQNLEEAQNQRMEFNQVQEDLLLANKDLARLAKSLKIMTQKAEDARRVKEEFVANVSHELRTPLNMIIGYTNLIITSPGAYAKRLPARLMADIASIHRNCHHLLELVNDVLDLSQVDAGRMALTRQWSSMYEIIDSALVAVKPLFESKGLYLRKELETPDVLVFCDSTRVREVVLNLLSNAGRFTDFGGVVVALRKSDDRIEILVSDTGPGISLEDQQRIFEPFQQLAPMLHHKTGGSGLGLTISKRFVEMHDGEMTLSSEKGCGTTFSVKLPIDLKIDLEVGRTDASRWVNPYQDYQPRPRSFRAPHPISAPRFLIVEEEGTIQRLFSRYLDGIEFVSTNSIEDALRQLELVPYQALLLNSSDKDVDDSIKVPNPFNTPIVSCWMPGREEAARQIGVVHYLLKPVEQSVFLKALDEIGKTEMNVLLVDDDPETIQLFARIISIARPDARVIRASQGREALQIMHERLPDVVVLDLLLQDMNGFDLLAEKKMDERVCNIPVIIVSSTDPSGIPIIANRFSVSCNQGMSAQQFLNCITTVSEILNSDSQIQHPERLKMLPA